MAAVRLIAPNGSEVTVAPEKVDGLLGRGFKKPEAKKTAAKKSSSKSEK